MLERNKLYSLFSVSEMNNKMFAQYPDVVDVKQLKEMLGYGYNKIYELLENKEIYSKRIGWVYKIPKVSVIDYLMREGR